MAIELYFDVWASDDPKGDALGELTQAYGKKVVDGFNGEGSGEFTINRHDSQATSGWVRTGNLVRVRTEAGGPFEYDDARYGFAFYIEGGSDAPVGTDEEGSDEWKRGGRGIVVVLEKLLWWWDNFMGQQGTRDDGKWHWVNDQFGDILRRSLQEWNARPSPPPIPDNLSWDFTGTTDSDSNAWPSFDGGFTIDIGTNYYEAARLLASQGIEFNLSPAFVMSAWIEDGRGSDRTDEVVWREGWNIREGGDREVHSAHRGTRALVKGDSTDLAHYIEATLASTATDETGKWGRREIFVQYERSHSAAPLRRAGQKALARSKLLDLGPTTIGVTSYLNDDEVDGDGGSPEALRELIPWVDYRVGDMVTLDIPGEYNNAAKRVVQIALNDAENGEAEVTVTLGESPFDPSVSAASAYSDPNSGPGGEHSHPAPCQPIKIAEGGAFRIYPSLWEAEENEGPTTEEGTDPDALDAPELAAEAFDAIWDEVDDTNTVVAYPAPANSGAASGSGHGWAHVNFPVSNVMHQRHVMRLDRIDGLQDAIAAGGAEFLGYLFARSRSGLGISEASQYDLAQVVVRIWDVSASTMTTLAGGHALPAGNRFTPQTSNEGLRRFPPAAAPAMLDAYPDALPEDYLVIEHGSLHLNPTSGGAGAATFLSDVEPDTADAAEDETIGNPEDGSINTWYELRAADSVTIPGPHEQLVGTELDYARCDHRHLIISDVEPTPDESDATGYPRGTMWAQLDDIDYPESIIGFWISVIDTTGSAVWLQVSSGGPGSSTLEVLEEGVPVVSPADAIDFGAGFDVSESPSGTALVELDLTEVTLPPTLLVEEIDGTPTETPVDTLRFPADTLTEPAAGEVTYKPVSELVFGWDNGNAPLTTAANPIDIPIDAAFDIEQVTMLAVPVSGSGSAVVDLGVDTYGNFPPAPDSIVASAPPTITSAIKSQDSTLTGWTTALAAGSTLRATLTSTSGLKSLTIGLKLRRK